jgi:hypothetical protein
MTRPLRIFSHYISGRSLILIFGDVLILTASVYVGGTVQVPGLPPAWLGFSPILPKVVVFVLLGILTFHVASLYDSRPQLGRKEVMIRGVAASVVWGILYAAAAFLIPGFRLGRMAAVLGLGIGTLGVIGLRWLLLSQKASGRFRERLLFLGATPVAERLISELEANNPGYEVLGYVDDRPAYEVSMSNGFCVLGTTQQLQEIAATTEAETIVVALAERRGAFPAQAMLNCKLRGVRIEDWPAFYEKLTGKIVVQNLRPSWLVFSEGFNRTRVTRLVKRGVDLTLSSLLLGLGWPIFLLVAIAIKLDSPGPVFFRQERVGERGRIFNLLKFRTMRNDAEALTGTGACLFAKGDWAGVGDPGGPADHPGRAVAPEDQTG